MFTGIVEGTGAVREMTLRDGNARLVIETAVDLAGIRTGESIAVSGACLTVVEHGSGVFAADLSGETLVRTTLGGLTRGQTVNLEKALRAGDPLGGHLVTGHVDGVGELLERRRQGGSERWSVSVPETLRHFMVEKGSVCVDGVSLTISGAEGLMVHLDLIPHTLAVTTLGAAQLGQRINLEVDLVARYVEGLLAARE